MSDSFSETTSTSWFGRIGNSIKGIVFGAILFIASLPVLWLNEKNSAETIAGLKQLLKEAVTVTADAVNPEYEGKPVHMSGHAETAEVLNDAEFGVSANAIKLARQVEMYQWQENQSTKTRKKLGGGEEKVTTYDYVKVWSREPIRSDQFHEGGRAKHQNPPMPFASATEVAEDVSLGAFRLSSFLIDRMNQREPLHLDPAQREKLPAELRAKLKDGGPGYYLGADPASPAIGDVKIRFHVVNPATVSIIAQQIGATFEKFHSNRGKSFGLLEMGEHSKESVVQVAKKQNTIFTWILRFVGWLLMFIGVSLVLKPLSVLADVVPFIGNVVGFGSGLIAAIVTFSLSLLVISAAWIVYRPLISIPLAIVAVGLLVFALTRKRKRRA